MLQQAEKEKKYKTKGEKIHIFWKKFNSKTIIEALSPSTSLSLFKRRIGSELLKNTCVTRINSASNQFDHNFSGNHLPSEENQKPKEII